MTVPPCLPYSSPVFPGPVISRAFFGSQPDVVIFETWSKVFTSWIRRPMFSRHTSFAAGGSPSLGFLNSSFRSST